MKTAKQIGASGQISFGKEFSERTVVVDSNEPGVWVIKTARTIPDSELWCISRKPPLRAMAPWETASQRRSRRLGAASGQGPSPWPVMGIL